jgi:hypothetical protein
MAVSMQLFAFGQREGPFCAVTDDIVETLQYVRVRECPAVRLRHEQLRQGGLRLGNGLLSG